jgi:hypothetical protein
MTKPLTLDELLKMNPHLDRAEIERTLKTLGQTPARPRRERAPAPDRLRVGDPSRARKVRLRYTL